jgi:hypothetical protein
MKGSTTYLPNAKGRAVISSTIAAASPAHRHRVSLLPASHITETAGNEIKVIIVLPALTPIDATPHAAARTKKKRKKATCNVNAIYRPHHKERHDNRQDFGHLRCGCRRLI